MHHLKKNAQTFFTRLLIVVLNYSFVELYPISLYMAAQQPI